ncbi:MAG: MerR family transcriptional regulator [Burkholderiales bacterium]|nr:MerR family transcriptional regulator [Burkholderiales bacterium]
MNASLCVEEDFVLDIDALGRACRCEVDVIVAFVQEGVLEPQAQAPGWTFDARMLQRARRALRLMRDFELGPAGVALALQLLDRIELLERQLHAPRSG